MYIKHLLLQCDPFPMDFNGRKNCNIIVFFNMMIKYNVRIYMVKQRQSLPTAHFTRRGDVLRRKDSSSI